MAHASLTHQPVAQGPAVRRTASTICPTRKRLRVELFGHSEALLYQIPISNSLVLGFLYNVLIFCFLGYFALVFVSFLRQGQMYSWNPYGGKALLQLWAHTRIRGLHHHTSGLLDAGLHLDLPVNRGLLSVAHHYLSHIPGQDYSFKPNWILVDIWLPWSSWSFHIHFNITSFNSPSKDCQKSIP